jgi:MarR-like DNA-binding transcriptional regulator SgrR of sgrS sRNA
MAECPISHAAMKRDVLPCSERRADLLNEAFDFSALRWQPSVGNGKRLKYQLALLAQERLVLQTELRLFRCGQQGHGNVDPACCHA